MGDSARHILFTKQLTLPFTEDVQNLQTYFETTVQTARQRLTEIASPQIYPNLAKATLAQIIVFNHRRAGEVSKMGLKNFNERVQSQFHDDVALGLTKFEKKLCGHGLKRSALTSFGQL